MDIFDSNIWVFAITQTCPEAEALVEQTLDGDREVAVSSYIHQEVVNAIHRTKHGRHADDLEDQFNKLLVKCDHIQRPIQLQVRDEDVEGRREMMENLVIAQIMGCQPKDAPIINYAHNYRDEQVVIHTNDESFSKVNPSEYDLNYLSIRYVDC